MVTFLANRLKTIILYQVRADYANKYHKETNIHSFHHIQDINITGYSQLTVHVIMVHDRKHLQFLSTLTHNPLLLWVCVITY